MNLVQCSEMPNSQIPYLTLQVNRTQSVANTTLSLNIIYPSTQQTLLPNIKISKFTLPIFLERARLIHGNKYNYDKITDIDIRNKFSEITITCNLCGHEWITTIKSHIYGKNNCPSCTGHLRWTYNRFMQRAKEIHGNKFNYDIVDSGQVINNESRIPVKCNTCYYQWTPTIHNHINSRSGCPCCAGNAAWTYNRFIEKCIEIHKHKFNYEFVLPEHITNVYSDVTIICNICDNKWTTNIHTHINGKSGCPSCLGVTQWTLERFIIKARETHGDKFNYDKIRNCHIKGVNSRVPIICNDCKYEWFPRIGNHINGKYSCPSCSNKEPWSLNRFLSKAKETHGDKYNYSLITFEMIETGESKIPIICNKCQITWNPMIRDHINGRTGCPICSASRGFSNAQIDWLETIMQAEHIDIKYALSLGGEYIIPTIGKVDGYCRETNTVYEFHGDFWHGNPNKFDQNIQHPICRKTYGELYAKTLERDQNIRDLGYNLIVKWETPPS